MRSPLKPPQRTEERNPASRGLDRLSTEAILRLMNREDRKVPIQVGREIAAIASAVDAAVRGIRRGGRLIYVGSGTSGRLAVLDAAESPPTFSVSSQLVQAVIAGGRRALTEAIEGAEDSYRGGARDIAQKKIKAHDVVVGVSASGMTPYVVGALDYARRRRATTVAITSNRDSTLARTARIKIIPDVGPEVVAGSTRLKAGTAQKLVLNMLSTATMVRLGHAYDNWMVDVAQTNAKLRSRKLLILCEATGKDVSLATQALRQSGHNLRVALVMLKKNVSAEHARTLLRNAGGNLRRALGE